MNTNDKSCGLATVPKGVGDAVGMEKSQWYVAIVKYNTEKSCAEKLKKLNIIHYLPIQKENRVWKNGRKAKVDRVVIPSTIFVYCTERQRRNIVSLPFINRFMTDKAGTVANGLHKPLAIIPDVQIDQLKFMLGQSDIPIEITEKPFKKGDQVRVFRGSLTGLEGEVIDMKKARSELIVAIDFFGCARLSIDTINLEIKK